jgi:hypothetical protein
MERSLTWMAAGILSRFTCTHCAWSHPNPSSKDSPSTLDSGVLKLIQRAFSQHLCSRHPFLRPATSSGAVLDSAASNSTAHLPW